MAEVSDGRQALEMIQIVKPDVVFTDRKMPYMGGIELIKAAQAAGMQAKYVKPVYVRTGYFSCSGYGEGTENERSLSAEGIYLDKPMDQREL